MSYKSDIPSTIKAFTNAEDKTLNATGFLIRDAARLLQKPDKGRLRQSIDKAVDNINHSVAIGTNVKYAEFVEFGTGIHNKEGKGRTTPWVYYDVARDAFFTTEGNKPQPFLTPAFENNIDEMRKQAEKYYAELDK